MIFEPGLIRRIESSSARVTMATAASFAARAAGTPARAVPFAGGTLAAFGPGRYVNRAVGVSLDDLEDDQLDELEAFFTAAGVPPSLEVASWAPATLVARLATRGYTVFWFRNVYVAALDDGLWPHHPAMTVDQVGPTAAPLTWLRSPVKKPPGGWNPTSRWCDADRSPKEGARWPLRPILTAFHSSRGPRTGRGF